MFFLHDVFILKCIHTTPETWCTFTNMF